MNSINEIKYLTGIRGVAVLLVLLAHMLPAYHFNKSIAFLGMSLFFVLSGTVLAYVWGARFYSAKTNLFHFGQTFFSFIWARFSRMAPLYLVVGIPYVASSNIPWRDTLAMIPRYLLGMQSWFYDVTSDGVIKQLYVYAHSWSVSSEVFLYLLFPFLLIYLCGRKAWIQLLIALGLYTAYCITLIYVAKTGLYTSPGYPLSQTWLDWFVYLSPYGRVTEFLMGILIGSKLMNSSQIKSKSVTPSFHGIIALALIIGIIIWLSIDEAKGSTHSTMILLRMGPIFTLPICYLLFALARGNDLTEKFFCAKPLVSIGVWSYSVYLFQGYGAGYSFPGFSQIIQYAFEFLVIILLSAGSYQLIEAPCRRILLLFDPVNKIFIWDKMRINLME